MPNGDKLRPKSYARTYDYALYGYITGIKKEMFNICMMVYTIWAVR